MKTTIIYMLLFCFLIMSFASCNEQKESNTKSLTKTIEMDTVVPTDTIFGDCTELYASNHRKDNALSVDAIKEYIEDINVIKADLKKEGKTAESKSLIYGVNVDISELREVLIKSKRQDSLWIMMAVNDAGETDMIFSLQSNPIAENTEAEPCWSFFDFTQACPHSCPKFPIGKLPIND